MPERRYPKQSKMHTKLKTKSNTNYAIPRYKRIGRGKEMKMKAI